MGLDLNIENVAGSFKLLAAEQGLQACRKVCALSSYSASMSEDHPAVWATVSLQDG